jgi:hypothetical protein
MAAPPPGPASDDDDRPSPYDHVTARAAPPGADAFLAARLGDVEALRWVWEWVGGWRVVVFSGWMRGRRRQKSTKKKSSPSLLIADAPDIVLHRDAFDGTALFYASLAGHEPAVRLLLERGAIADEATFEGTRALYAALKPEIRAALRAARAVAPPLCALGAAFAPLAPLPAAGPSWLAPAGPEAAAARHAAPAGDLELRTSDGGSVRAHRCLLWRAPALRGRWGASSTAWLASPALDRESLVALIGALATDRVEVRSGAAPGLAAAARSAGLRPLAAAVRAELHTQAHYARLKRRGGGGGGGGGGPAGGATRFVVHPSSLPPAARLAPHLAALASASAALAAAGVTGPGDDAADVLLIPAGAPTPLRAHAALLAARSPFFHALLRHRGLVVAAGEVASGRAAAPRPPEGGDLPAVAVGAPRGALAAALCFAYSGQLPPGCLGCDASGHPDPAAVVALVDTAESALLGGMKRAVAASVAASWAAAPRPPPLRAVCEILLAADARGAATLRRAALGRAAAAFDGAAAAVEAAAGAGAAPPRASDAAALLAFVAAAAAAAAPAAAPSLVPGVAVAGVGTQTLVEDLREAYLERSAAPGPARDAAAGCFDARLAALADAAGVARPVVG